MKDRHQISDRISALPQDTIEKILTVMPIRDAVRTSILSSKWRYSWTTIPKLVFDDNMVESSRNRQLDRYKFVMAILQVLLLHKGPILEFSLSVYKEFSEIDQIILHLSRSNNIKKFTLGIRGRDNMYSLPCSLFSLQGLEHLDLSNCKFEELLLLNKGFSMLKSLRLCNVGISDKFLTNCPLIEEFTMIRVNDDIEFTEREFVSLFKSLPSVQVLQISRFSIEHSGAGSMPHKLPFSLPHLRILVLDVCFLELSSVLCIINSSPNLEKIKVEMCWDHDGRCLKQNVNNLLDDQDYSGLNLDHLRELEMTSFNNYAPEMEFVKLVIAKSPVLKKARIELHYEVSVDEENKMLRDLMRIPFLRTSPITIERPRN